jgi:hypothetical protein
VVIVLYEGRFHKSFFDWKASLGASTNLSHGIALDVDDCGATIWLSD